jgi:hypothetical protein
MRKNNGKHGRKSSGHKHGGKGLKRTGKRRAAPTTARKGTGGPLEMAAPPRPFEDQVGSRSIPTRAVEPSLPAALHAPASERPIPRPEPTEPPRKAATARPATGHGQLAFIAVLVAAVCGIALLRACEPPGTPVEDDATAADSCASDASLCVAWA